MILSMSSPTQQLAEQSLQTDTLSARTLDKEGKSGGLRRGGQVSVASPSQAGERRLTRMARVTRQEWAPSILIFFLDIVTWMALYGTASYLRDHDAAFSGSFQFAAIEIIQIAVIVQALFIIGGYSPRTETRGLAYTAEHILALLCALGISAFVIYVAATYDHSMKPSRFAILSSFLVFIPASLFYRRALRTHVTAAAADSLRLQIEVPAQVPTGRPVPIVVRARNAGRCGAGS